LKGTLKKPFLVLAEECSFVNQKNKSRKFFHRDFGESFEGNIAGIGALAVFQNG